MHVTLYIENIRMSINDWMIVVGAHFVAGDELAAPIQ